MVAMRTLVIISFPFFLVSGNTFIVQEVVERIARGVRMFNSTTEFYPTVTSRLTFQKGFSPVTYTVVTEDGYILSLHRATDSIKRRPPVLLMHGLLGSSEGWLDLPKNDLVTCLTKSGYDVWLGDVRGNYYSQNHVKYSKSDQRFWDFSFHEDGYYDLPAMIDTILRVTGEEKLFYVGHSMGGTLFSVMASLRPEYNKKIRLAVLLAPAHYLEPPHLPLHFENILKNHQIVYNYLTSLGVGGVFQRSKELNEALVKTCQRPDVRELCFFVTGLLFGQHRDNIDEGAFDQMLSNIPSGTSLKTLEHFLQNVFSRRFQVFDYGPEENKVRYGSAIPPLYNLTQITAPVAYIYAKNDVLITPKVSQRSARLFGNIVQLYQVPDPGFNHVDFLTGKNAKAVVYDLIIKLFNKYC